MANVANAAKTALTLVVDTFKNFVANVNTGRDKQQAGDYYLQPFADTALSTIYRTSWMARKGVDIPAKDATREWREWNGTADQIELLEELERKLQIQQKVRKALQMARLYGGAGIYFSIKNDDPALPLDIESVTSDTLDFITVLARNVLVVGEFNLDPMSPGYGTPEWYQVSSPKAGTQVVHASRVAAFVGNEILTPEEMTGQHQGWGDSVLQSSYEPVRNADSIAANIASLVYEAKIDVLQIPNLADIMADSRTRTMLEQRVVLAAQLKGNNGMLVIDKEEGYEQKSYTFTGLPDINMQALQSVSGSFDVPITRFLGQSPAGLNSTGESDLENYYDSICSLQGVVMTPAMSLLDEAIIRSALGTRPTDVFYEWRPLWQMSAEQQSKISKETADTIKVLAESALFPPDALAEASVNMLVEHSNMSSLEFTQADVDAMHEEEQALLEQQQKNMAAKADPEASGSDPTLEE